MASIIRYRGNDEHTHFVGIWLLTELDLECDKVKPGPLSVEIIRDGRSPFSNTHGKSSLVISSENQEDLHVLTRPSSSSAGNHPLMPVRESLA